MGAASFYRRLDADRFAATEATASPWDERLQHGGPPTALVAHVMNALHPRPEMRLARITSEFLGVLPRAEMRVLTRVTRPGRRIELLEGVVESAGREVLSARVWRIATKPEGSVPAAATTPDPAPPIPEPEPPPGWMKQFGYGQAFEWRHVYGGGKSGPAAVWARPRIPLVDDAAPVPLDQVLLIADSANGISAELPMAEWLFVPPSLSIALERYPRDEWTLLEARTTLSSDGLGVTTLRLADTDGYIGAGTQALIVERQPQRAQ